MIREYWSVARDIVICDGCGRLITSVEKVLREVDDTPWL